MATRSTSRLERRDAYANTTTATSRADTDDGNARHEITRGHVESDRFTKVVLHTSCVAWAVGLDVSPPAVAAVVAISEPTGKRVTVLVGLALK